MHCCKQGGAAAGVTRFGKRYEQNHLIIEDETGRAKLILWDQNTKMADGITGAK